MAYPKLFYRVYIINRQRGVIFRHTINHWIVVLRGKRVWSLASYLWILISLNIWLLLRSFITMLATKCKILFWPFQISLNEYSSKKNKRNSTLAPTPLLRIVYTKISSTTVTVMSLKNHCFTNTFVSNIRYLLYQGKGFNFNYFSSYHWTYLLWDSLINSFSLRTIIVTVKWDNTSLVSAWLNQNLFRFAINQ